MSKVRFSFDSDKLSYNKITLSTRQKIFRFLGGAVVLIVGAGLILLALSVLFETTGEKIQKRENKQLLFQYELLSQKVENMTRNMDEIQRHDDNIYRLIFGVEPNNIDTLTSEKRRSELAEYSNTELIAMAAQKLDSISYRLNSKTDIYDEVQLLAQKKTRFLASVPSLLPIENNATAQVAAGFGYCIHPFYRTLKMHQGIDITAPEGTLVYATGNGKVLSVENHPSSSGRIVVIDHGFGYKTVYAHLGKTMVRAGQRLQRGDAIGEVGSTGRSTAPHLHYEVLHRNKPENPINYFYTDLTPQKYNALVSTSSRTTMSFD